MKRFLVLSALAALCGLNLVGCGGGSGTTLSSNPQAGAVFVTGEDAPLPSVVSLNLTINSITLTGASNSPQLVSSPHHRRLRSFGGVARSAGVQRRSG
jgi:hypothetical protein